jgi:hypothetical protein
VQQDHEDEEEFVLLDLNCLSGILDIPPNAPYVLSVCSRLERGNSLRFIKLSKKL